jgi:hypothetical protein
VGGSTITQQVAKNILLGDEYSVTRKLKEMILAAHRRGADQAGDHGALPQRNPARARSFGVQAAARAYFDKDVDELELHEMAFLAILPKAPERYGRKGQEQARRWSGATSCSTRWRRTATSPAEAARCGQGQPSASSPSGRNVRSMRAISLRKSAAN